MPSPGSRQFVGPFFSDQKLLPQNPRNLSLASARSRRNPRRATLLVLVQSEMEKNIFRLVKNPQFWEYNSPTWAGMFLDFSCRQTDAIPHRADQEDRPDVARSLR